MEDTLEAKRLLMGHVAETLEEAKKIIRRKREQGQKSNTVIFYEDFNRIRSVFEKLLFEEEGYRGEVRIAYLPSGSLGRIRRNGQGGLILAALRELISKETPEPRIIAIAKNFPYNSKSGLFFTPWNGEEVEAKGKTTLDQRLNLERIEFWKQYGSQHDYVTSIFSAWKEHPLSESNSLVLYIPRQEVLRFS